MKTNWTDFLDVLLKLLAAIGGTLFFVFNLTYVQSATFNAKAAAFDARVNNVEKQNAVIETCLKKQNDDIKEIKTDVKLILQGGKK